MGGCTECRREFGRDSNDLMRLFLRLVHPGAFPARRYMRCESGKGGDHVAASICRTFTLEFSDKTEFLTRFNRCGRCEGAKVRLDSVL